MSTEYHHDGALTTQLCSPAIASHDMPRPLPWVLLWWQVVTCYGRATCLNSKCHFMTKPLVPWQGSLARVMIEGRTSHIV